MIKSKWNTSGGRQWRPAHVLPLSKQKSIKGLSKGVHASTGRNHQGRVCNWHRGGGHKRKLRSLSFISRGIGLCLDREHLPRHSSFGHRVFIPDLNEGHTKISKGCSHTYILGVEGLSQGHSIYGPNLGETQMGNHFPLYQIPQGFSIHNLCVRTGKPSQYLKAAGAYGLLIQKNAKQTLVKLKSGKYEVFSSVKASASLGKVGNQTWFLRVLGKAGRNRYVGIRPTVRGVAMNPVDHPHGGGEGKTSGGRPSVTPWGKPTKGQPTLSRQKKRNRKLHIYNE